MGVAAGVSYLLDTNVISELRRPRPHGAVLAWLAEVDEADLFISAASLGEIQAGIEMTREQDAAKAAEIEAWADLLPQNFNILRLDVETFRLWAKLKHGRPQSLSEDAMIAAVAMTHGFTVVTRNMRDFKGFGVALHNPFGG